MNGFFRCHPAVILLYYIIAFLGLIWLGHPYGNIIILIMVFLTYFLAAGFSKGIKMLWAGALVSILCVLVNPLLNHRGVTLLFQIKDTRFTWEALIYGGYMAEILITSLLLFAGFSKAMTAEKIMTLTGKALPAFSLLFSMVLRFVPKAAKDFRGMTAIHGNKPSVLSALIGMEMEQSMERSISMKDRYYGKRKRTSYYAKKLSLEDILLLIIMILYLVTMCWTHLVQGEDFQFFPSLKISRPPFGEIIGITFFYGIPLWMWGKEEVLWILSRRKITGITMPGRKNRPLK